MSAMVSNQPMFRQERICQPPQDLDVLHLLTNMKPVYLETPRAPQQQQEMQQLISQQRANQMDSQELARLLTVQLLKQNCIDNCHQLNLPASTVSSQQPRFDLNLAAMAAAGQPIDMESLLALARGQQQQPMIGGNNRVAGRTANGQAINSSRYKSELCRSFEETGRCKYGDKCQFAHGLDEMRSLQRHPKYKTELCRTFHSEGMCPYGQRCHFVHEEDTFKLAELRARTLPAPPPQRVVDATHHLVPAGAVPPRTSVALAHSLSPLTIGSAGESPRSSMTSSPTSLGSPSGSDSSVSDNVFPAVFSPTAQPTTPFPAFAGVSQAQYVFPPAANDLKPTSNSLPVPPTANYNQSLLAAAAAAVNNKFVSLEGAFNALNIADSVLPVSPAPPAPVRQHVGSFAAPIRQRAPSSVAPVPPVNPQDANVRLPVFASIRGN